MLLIVITTQVIWNLNNRTLSSYIRFEIDLEKNTNNASKYYAGESLISIRSSSRM